MTADPDPTELAPQPAQQPAHQPAPAPAPLPPPPAPPLSLQLDDPEDLFPAHAEGLPPHEFGELLPPQPPERSVVKRVVYLVIGIVLVLIGTVLWVTPIIGGAPLFWIPGCIFLAKASDPVRRLINFGDSKMPRKVRQLFRWARDKAGAKPKEPASPADATADAAKSGETDGSPSDRPAAPR